MRRRLCRFCGVQNIVGNCWFYYKNNLFEQSEVRYEILGKTSHLEDFGGLQRVK